MTRLRSESEYRVRGWQLRATALLMVVGCSTLQPLDSSPIAHSASGIFSVGTRQKSDDEKVNPLKMTAEILGQRYCIDTGFKEFTIIFKIRVRLINQSSKRLIVEKPNSGFNGFCRVVIARDTNSLSAGKLEYDPNTNVSVTFNPAAPPEDLTTPGKKFAILSSGESLVIEDEVRAASVGRRLDASEKPDTAPPGNHVLQITVPTWGERRVKPEEMRKRWEPFGYLVYEYMTSEPLPFVLPLDPKIDPCR
jgi:hypothetical protein